MNPPDLDSEMRDFQRRVMDSRPDVVNPRATAGAGRGRPLKPEVRESSFPQSAMPRAESFGRVESGIPSKGGGGGEPGAFEPFISGNVDDGWEVTVTKGLCVKMDDGTYVSVSGLESGIEAEDGDFVYLEMVTDGEGTITGISVQVGEWDGFPSPVKFSTSDPYPQTHFYYRLADVVAPTPETLVLENRYGGGNLSIVSAFIDGKLALILQ